MIRKYLALAGLLVSLDACTGPPPPTYTDAFSGIYKQSAASVPADVAVTVQSPVGIILSDNMDAYIGWVKAQEEYWHVAAINPVAEADGNPTFVANQVLAMLKSRVPDATKVHDLREAVGAGKKAVVLIDLRATFSALYGAKTTNMDIVAYFFDASMKPVSRIAGHGEHKMGFVYEPTLQIATDRAVKDLDAKISTLVH
jgi:hypothetical protein